MEILSKQKKVIISAGLLASFLLPLLFTFFGRNLLILIAHQANLTASLFFIGELFIWIILGAIYYYTLKIEKSPFLYWPPKKYIFLDYIKVIIVTIVINFIIALVLAFILKLLGHTKQSDKMILIINLLRNNMPLLLFCCLTAGVTEELIFRGYMMPRLQLLFNNTYITIFISSLVFAFCHLSYFTLNQFIGTFFVGLLFACQYQKYRNIKMVMISHFLYDLIVFLIQIRLPHKHV